MERERLENWFNNTETGTLIQDVDDYLKTTWIKKKEDSTTKKED